MAKLDQVLILDPAVELHFEGPFVDVVTSYLKLTNPSEQRVCFKVKTTAPKKYCVRPNSGILEPKQVQNVAVMLQPFDYNPNEKNKHKFMVQTMFVPEGEINPENLWRDAKPESLMDSKLRCVFDMPAEASQNNNLDSNAVQGEVLKTNASKPVTETVKETSKEAELVKIVEHNKKLRDELQQLKQENLQLKEESMRLRLRTNASSDAVGRGSSSVTNPSQTDSAKASASVFSGDRMTEQQQSPMLYLAVILTIGLLGIFIGKFIV